MEPSDDAAQLTGPASQPEHLQPRAACTLPLLQLPDTAKEAITALLRVGYRRSLRLTCAATQLAVDLDTHQLKFTRLAPLKAGLAARFPRVAHLHLDNVDHAKDEDTGEEVTLAAREDRQPWSTVTSARLVCLAPDAIAYVVSRCPGLQSLELSGVLGGAGLEDTLAYMPGALPNLRLLSVRRPALGDAELAALPSFTLLTDLTVKMGACSAAGWALLASMRHLRSLVLIISSSGVPKDVQLDLTAWSALSQLRISSRGDDELHKHLRLPGSLAELAVNRLPQLPLLRQLRVLELSADDCCFGSGDLQRLAAACPCLEQLTLPKLHLCNACHAAPLQRLTSLCVEENCASRPGTCLAAVFPALAHLCLHGKCGNMESDGVLFEGLLSLRHLDVGRNRRLDEEVEVELLDAGMSLCAADFGALCKLPLLSILRMNTVAVHITGLGRLSHLVQLKLVFVGMHQDWSFTDLSHMRTERPLARLKHVTFEFISMEDSDDYYSPFEYQLVQQEASSMIDAAIVWLSSAPTLHRLTWDAAAVLPEDNCHWGCITDLRLFGIIAACPSMKLLELIGRSSAGTSAAIIELVRQRGLEVVES